MSNQFWGEQALAKAYADNPQLLDPTNDGSFRRRLDLIKIARDNLMAEDIYAMDSEQVEDHRRRVAELQAKVDEMTEQMGFQVNLEMPGNPDTYHRSEGVRNWFRGEDGFGADEDETPLEGNRRTWKGDLSIE